MFPFLPFFDVAPLDVGHQCKTPSSLQYSHNDKVAKKSFPKSQLGQRNHIPFSLVVIQNLVNIYIHR